MYRNVNNPQISTLPKDHYAVFKNITRYSKWELVNLLELNRLPDTAAGRRELNNKSLVSDIDA